MNVNDRAIDLMLERRVKPGGVVVSRCIDRID
jgi:hypothetical protein